MRNTQQSILHKLGLTTATLAVGVLGTALMLTPGCDDSEPADELQDAAENVNDAANETAEKVGEEMDEAADEMQE